MSVMIDTLKLSMLVLIMAIGELFLRRYVFLNEATLRNDVRRRLYE